MVAPSYFYSCVYCMGKDVAMEATKNVAAFEQERAAVYEIINTGAMKDFLYGFAHDVVGRDRNGIETTLIEEVGEVARMAHRAYVSDGVNYYRSRSAFNRAESNEVENSQRMYIRAAKKLLFLNAVSRKLTGNGFIIKRIDIDDLDVVTELVDAFEFCVRNYAEV